MIYNNFFHFLQIITSPQKIDPNGTYLHWSDLIMSKLLRSQWSRRRMENQWKEREDVSHGERSKGILTIISLGHDLYLLAGEYGALRCQIIEIKKIIKIHLVSSGYQIWRIPFLNYIFTCIN